MQCCDKLTDEQSNQNGGMCSFLRKRPGDSRTGDITGLKVLLSDSSIGSVGCHDMTSEVRVGSLVTVSASALPRLHQRPREKLPNRPTRSAISLSLLWVFCV